MTRTPLDVCFYCADQNPHRDRSRGITNYTSGLLVNLAKRSELSLSAVISKSSFPLPVDIPATRLPFRTDRVLGRIVADHFHPLLRSNDAKTWHYPKGFLPLILHVNGRKIGTVADTILQHYADHYPESRNRLAFSYWIQMLKHSIVAFDAILTVSEFSKSAIQEFCARYQLNCPPLIVTYEGANISSQQLARPKEKQNYVVHLASSLPHKRTAWLLQQWRKFQLTNVELPPLRLIGARSLKLDIANLRNVELYPFLDGSEYESTLRRARALLLPSEIEGFGLPALEAYLVGTPVAYVKGTAVEEILGAGTPGGFTLNDDSFRAGLNSALGVGSTAIEAKAKELRDRFSWDNCVELTLNAYRMLG